VQHTISTRFQQGAAAILTENHLGLSCIRQGQTQYHQADDAFVIDGIAGRAGQHASHGGLVEMDAKVAAATVGTRGAGTGETQHGSRGHFRPFQRQW
jgi:hypothetical protein